VGLLGLLFSLNGRINRAQYWLGTIGVSVAVFVLVFVLMLSTGASLANARENPAAAVSAVARLALAIGPILLVSSWCGMALQVKRFHDRGRSGLWVLLPALPMTMLVSTLFHGVATNMSGAEVGAAMQPWLMFLWLINFAFFIDLACLPSKEGPNKYGNPPGAPPSSTPYAPSGAPAGKAAPAAAAASSLLGAQSAMDRAIAERARQPQGPVKAAASAPRTAASPASAAAPSFGRRVTR